MPEAYNPSTNTKKSPLEQISAQFVNERIASNRYSFAGRYGLNHPDALSDGDERGKGELNGSIGSKTDIITRKETVNKNTYDTNFAYNVTNPNALSDGDEKGKGELNGSIGSKTDINIRKDNSGRNKFNDNKRYPDF